MAKVFAGKITALSSFSAPPDSLLLLKQISTSVEKRRDKSPEHSNPLFSCSVKLEILGQPRSNGVGSLPIVLHLLFTDQDSVAATQISSVSGTGQVGHQLQVIPVSIHKSCHWYNLTREKSDTNLLSFSFSLFFIFSLWIWFGLKSSRDWEEVLMKTIIKLLLHHFLL